MEPTFPKTLWTGLGDIGQVEDLVDSVFICPDQITVQETWVSLLVIALHEVRPTKRYKPVVSETRRNRNAILRWRLEAPKI